MAGDIQTIKTIGQSGALSKPRCGHKIVFIAWVAQDRFKKEIVTNENGQLASGSLLQWQ